MRHIFAPTSSSWKHSCSVVIINSARPLLVIICRLACVSKAWQPFQQLAMHMMQHTADKFPSFNSCSLYYLQSRTSISRHHITMRFREISRQLLVAVCAVFLMSSSSSPVLALGVRASLFQTLRDSQTSSTFCALNPANSARSADTPAQCAAFCNNVDCCNSFNFKDDGGVCELYYPADDMLSFTTEAHCTYHQVPFHWNIQLKHFGILYLNSSYFAIA